MSHYTCLIIGPNPGAQLERFNENLDVEERLDECVMCCAEPRYMTDCEHCHGSGKALTTRNPDGRWDYWRVGGRWPGKLRLKPGASGHLEPLSYEWGYEKELPDLSGRADQALAGAVDWLATIAEMGDTRTYALVVEGAWREKKHYDPDAPQGERFVLDEGFIPFWDRLVTNLPADVLVTVVDYHS